MVSKSSRKGKKAWRKNISAKAEVAAVEQRTSEAVQGVAQLHDGDLFVIDKGRDDETAEAVRRGVRRRGEVRQLRSVAVLEAVHSGSRKPWGPKKGQEEGKGSKRERGKGQGHVAAKGRKASSARGEELKDLWADEPCSTGQHGGAAQAHANSWLDTDGKAAMGAKYAMWRRQRRNSKVPAVEVDAPGCSYNPDEEQRKDAVAVAIADSYRGRLNSSLGGNKERQVLRLLPELKGKDDIDAILGNQSDPEDENEGVEEDEADVLPACKPTTDENRKSQAQRNKEKRMREAERENEAKRAVKRQRQQIDSLPTIVKEIEVEEAEKEIYMKRKQAMKSERALERPPRLGKHRFKPASLPVLGSDDVAGSLRRLKPTSLLAMHRYKSVLKRGLVPVCLKGKRKKAKRYVWYVAGERGRNAQKMQQELEAVKAVTKRMKRALGPAPEPSQVADGW